MSIKPEDLKLEDVHNAIRAVQAWKTELTDINVTPESVAAIYVDCAELKGTLATKSVYEDSERQAYFKHLINQTYDGKIDTIFNTIAPNRDFTGCAGHYTFSFLNKDQEKTDLHATFEFKANKDGLTYHHSYKAEETPEDLESQLPDDYQDFENGQPDALDTIEPG